MDLFSSRPQDSRFIAILLGFVGGATDVYSHLQFESLVATQTGNIILMASNIVEGRWGVFFGKLVSIIFFTLGFLLGIVVKERAKSAYWRVYTVLPLFFSTLIIPFLPPINLLWIIILAFSSGLIILTFTGSCIESEPYVIMMTSGNYRRMLQSWYVYLLDRKKDPVLKRKAINYSFVVLAFVVGALASAWLYHLIKVQSIWLVTLALALVLILYIYATERYQLHKSNR